MATQHQRRSQYALLALLVSMLAQHNLARADALRELGPTGPIKLSRLGFRAMWQSQSFHDTDSYVAGYWDTALARGFSPTLSNLPNGAPASMDLRIAAILRYQRNDGTGLYAEAGTGPLYQSFSYQLAGGPQGSRLALNTRASIGFIWKNGLDLGFKAIHVTRGQGPEGNDAGSSVGIGLNYRW